MKKYITILIIFLSLSSYLVFAHPGRTDSNGGHWVRTEGWGYEVGTYHYHNGGSVENYFSKETEEEKEARIKKKQEELLQQQKEEEQRRKQEERRKIKQDFENRGRNVIWASLFISFIWIWWIYCSFSELKDSSLHETKIKLLIVPDNIYINEKGFPEGFYETEEGMASYTIYYSSEYGKYHQYFCRYAKNSKFSCSILDTTKSKPCIPCALCERPLPDWDWYKNASAIIVLDFN